MSTVEESKIIQANKEEVYKKILELRAKQLKEDKQIFENYEPGWFENLLDFDITCLKELEKWMDNVIEKENSPELTQLWVFQRDLIRFSYYFLTFRWVKLVKENYFAIKVEHLYSDYINYLKEDFQKNNLKWLDDSFSYLTLKIQQAYQGETWDLVESTCKVARAFKDATIEWYEYYVEYNKKVAPQIKQFACNHKNEVKDYIWNRFQGVLRTWINQLKVTPQESLDYSFTVLENYFLVNKLVRASFFEDSKRLVPLQAKQISLQTQLGWKHISNKFGNIKNSLSNSINSSLVSYLSVEESEVFSLRQEGICSLLKQEYPLRLQKGLNLFTLAFFRIIDEEKEYESRSNKFIKLNQDIEKKLDEVFKRKEQRLARINALQSVEKKSDETVENRKKKLEVDFESNQKTTQQQYEKDVKLLESQIAEVSWKKYQVEKDVQESKRIQNEEYRRQQEQVKADKQYKIQREKELKQLASQKKERFDYLKEFIKKFDKQTEEKFQEKIKTIEQQNQARLAKEKRDNRKQELEKFEKAYFDEQEQIKQLQLKKKRIPKKKPEQLALEKQNLDELEQIRQAEEQEKLQEEQHKLDLKKAEEEKQWQNVMEKKFQSKLDGIQQWVDKKGQSINNFDPSKKLRNFYDRIYNSFSECLLWFTPVFNTVIYGPLDNFKITKQLGEKASYLYKAALSQRAFPQRETVQIPSIPEEIDFQQIKTKVKDMFNLQKIEVDPMKKGNLIRVLKHNIIGSDLMSIAFFKIVQDKLMQYTSGTYQNYNNIAAGALSGAMMAFLMNPIDCFKTLYVATDLKVQLSISNVHYRFTNGLNASIISNSVYRGIQFPLYEYFKRATYMKQYNIKEKDYEQQTGYFNHSYYNNFLSLKQKYLAAVSASLISSVFAYPLDTARKVIYTNTYIQDQSQHIHTIRQALAINTTIYGGFKYNCIKQIFQPLSLIVFDHATSKISNKSQINQYIH
ncbi:carrier protein (macronuclear) [Tetrahymena thermophila SB210]|uniref:Carrier protein n=1 Tax=Tetrahymena thermophila (strain SB210) TaxID=312017 RepID=I7LX08_TETTS|nr:carrier protein [Tetrahymena thermophila SB210]EAS03220.3 carrier protein [Tetrahymena thermophila SB210]|eukprot:XP_001023465.3 carrier protein [Tetrahymena thermophila SB210]